MKVNPSAKLWAAYFKHKVYKNDPSIAQIFEDEPPQDSWARKRYYHLKEYHLHPGNEVARALNTILLEFEDRRENNISTKLRKAGFPVRWDAKKGKFK